MTVDILQAADEGPLMLDSPHSGTEYPPDFAHACARTRLRRFEDSFVAELFGAGPALGATLVRARFARTYIDANRSLDDADPLLVQPSPAAQPTSEKARLGLGLVWRLLDDGTPIYDRPLTREEIDRRIEHCWRPYRRAVEQVHARVLAKHGFVIHLNCHSMPSVSPWYRSAPDERVPYDFVLGDRDGSTAAPALTRHVAGMLERRGYRVGLNDPFKGVDLVRQFGRPALHHHSLQLEVNKRLYMDEQRLQPNRGFAATRAALEDVMRSLLAFKASDLPDRQYIR